MVLENGYIRTSMVRCVAEELIDKISVPQVSERRPPSDVTMIRNLHTDSNTTLDNYNLVNLIECCLEKEGEEAGSEYYDVVEASGVDAEEHLDHHFMSPFSSSGNVCKARRVFDNLLPKNLCYTESDNLKEALRFYHQCRDERVQPTIDVYIALLKVCSKSASISEGRLIHSEIIGSGYVEHGHMSKALVAMYSRFANFEDALLVLQRLQKVDLIVWNSLVTGYAKYKESSRVLNILKCMQNNGNQPNHVTYVCALKSCSNRRQLLQGMLIHCDMLENGISPVFSQSILGNQLVFMYVKCGCLEAARAVFESLPERDALTWNILIDGYSSHGFVETALDVYHAMCLQGIQPTLVTFVCTLKACSVMRNLKQGQKIHSQLTMTGLKLDAIVENALLDLYSKCGRFEDSSYVFYGLPQKSVIAWNTVMAGYVSHQCGSSTLDFFRQMQAEGLQPDSVSFVCALKACSSLFDLDQGKTIHSEVIKNGLDLDLYIGNSLITMYGTCGKVEDAESVFERVQQRDVVTWSALMTGYANDGLGKEVLQTFNKMRVEGVEPDEAAFVCVLKACGDVAALEQGMELHAYAVENGYEVDTPVASTLITMYGKCGSLDMAILVLNRLTRPSVISFNAMVATFSEHGKSEFSVELYQNMISRAVKPNSITFICLLSACKKLDSVVEGCLFFRSMQRDHGIVPEVEHYGCMVEILSKAGHINAAEDLIETIPTACNIVCLISLLSSCDGLSDLCRGKRYFEYASKIDPVNSSVYVLMSKLYKVAGLHSKALEMESLRMQRNMWKKPGKAFIEVDKKVFEFVVGDKTHPKIEEINLKLKELSNRNSKIHNTAADESSLSKDRNTSLCGHSERLAIAFGLLNTNSGTTIRVSKNIRMCVDCHTTAKFTSSIENREIVVSDSYCVHNFREGICSCKE
ncbi:hypothetical protein KP509_10G025700 [Ceratopteris richardii]|nr:hypothetical protein KP509_10G025700 [Ceratopteris richardii]